jgi:hypothetical protein
MSLLEKYETENNHRRSEEFIYLHCKQILMK